MKPMARKHVLVRTLLYLHAQLERASLGAELSPSQYLLMHFLIEEPRLASDFAVVMRIKQPSVAGLVRTLEEKGWIERDVDADDRRARFARITDEGRRVFHAYETYLSEHLGSFLGAQAIGRANRDLIPLYDLWNDRRIERFETWADHHSARGKRRHRRASHEQGSKIDKRNIPKSLGAR